MIQSSIRRVKALQLFGSEATSIQSVCARYSRDAFWNQPKSFLATGRNGNKLDTFKLKVSDGVRNAAS